MKWHLKLLIAFLAIATAIHFFGPDFAKMDADHAHEDAHHEEHYDDHDEDDDHDHDHDHDHDDDRVMHYEIQKPKDTADASNILQERTSKIAAVIAKAKLDNNDLEKIHEHTYSLEAAVDKLRAEGAFKTEDSIDNLDEAVQALHYASENHEEATSREWFDRLKTALAKL